MPWQTRTPEQHFSDTIRDINAEMPGADAALARNNLHPVAKVVAGGSHSLDLRMAWTADQKFILTCADEFLDRHGAEMKPAVPRKAAAAATGPVTMTAASAVTLATGAILSRSDGEQFRVDAGVVAGSGASVTINVTAVKAGAASATLAAAPLTAASGLTGTATFAVGANGLGGAADAEANEPYRARLLFAKAFPEHGGAPADWLRYTLAVPGVTRAYIDPLAAGRGTVVVYPFFDLTRPNGIGLESDRPAVQSALTVAGPGAGLPIVRLPVPVAIPVTLAGVLPATPEVQAAIASEIAATFARQSRPAGLSAPHPSMPFLATPASFSRSWIWQAAANASGEERHSVTLPAADVALTEGQVAVPGAITFA